MIGIRAKRVMLAAVLVLGPLVGVVAMQTPASATPTVSVFAGTGSYGYTGDGGAATSAQIFAPTGLFADATGNVYFSDYGNKVIRKVDTSGDISTIAGNGGYPSYPCYATGPFTATSTSVYGAMPLAGDASGDLFFNYCQWTSVLYGSTIDRYAGISTFGTPSDSDGAKDSVLVSPSAMAYDDTDGALYFVQNQRIKEVTAAGNVVTVAGTGSCGSYDYDTESATSACIHPMNLAYWHGHLYFGDSYGGSRSPEIFRLDVWDGDSELHQIAGSGSSCWCDGSSGSSATSTAISSITDIAVSHRGEVYFGSSSYSYIRKVDTNGVMQDVADVGHGNQFMAMDASDNLYVSLENNAEIVKVSGNDPTPTGTLVALGDSVAAGEGTAYGFGWDSSSNEWVQTGPTTPTWSDTTASLGSNIQDCHQSDASYVQYFTDYAVYNMACTGATASYGVLGSQSITGGATLPPQLGGTCFGCGTVSTVYDAHDPDVVLLSVGADDIDFRDWLYNCYSPTYGACGTTSDQTTIDGELNTEEQNLRTTLTELNRRAGLAGKSVEVVVSDYYDPYKSPSASCIDTVATALSGTYPGIGTTSTEQAWIKSELSALNTNIYDEYLYANTNDTNLVMKFADLQSIMIGHQFCDSDPWVYGASIDYPIIGTSTTNPTPFHPTPRGQEAIYAAVRAAM